MECPVCKSENTFVFRKGLFDCEKTNVIECNNCGLQFLDKPMTAQEEDEFYFNYFENQKNRQFKDVTIKSLQDRAVFQYNDNSEIYSEILKKPKDILEIGSGSGGFLRFIVENFEGKNLCCAERSQVNRDFLRNDCEGIFDSVNFFGDISEIQSQKFDLITAFGVFEHIVNSREFLQSISGLLKDSDSKLVMTFANKHTPLGYLFELEEFLQFSYMKMHPYTFTEKAVGLLAEETGYKVDEFKYLQVWGLDNTFSWLKNKKPADFSKYSNFFSRETLLAYRNDLVKNKMTDLMMVIMSKK